MESRINFFLDGFRYAREYDNPVWLSLVLATINALVD